MACSVAHVGGHEHFSMCMHEVQLVPDSIHLIVFALRTHSEPRSYVASSHALCRQNKRIRGQRTVSCIARGQACRAREPHQKKTILYASRHLFTGQRPQPAVLFSVCATTVAICAMGPRVGDAAIIIQRRKCHTSNRAGTSNEVDSENGGCAVIMAHTATPSRHMNRHNWQTAVPPRWRVSRAVQLTCAPCLCHQGAPMARVAVSC